MRIFLTLLFSFLALTAYPQQDCSKGCIYDYNDFSKGINLKLSEFSLPKNQATIAENIRFGTELKSLTKRDEILNYGVSDVSEAITGMHRLYLKDGTKKLVVSHGDEIEVGDDDAGTFTTILDLTTGGYKWQFLTWHNILIGTDGYNQPIKWDGSSISATYLGSCLATDADGGAGPSGTYKYKISYYTTTPVGYEVLLDTPSNTLTVVDNDINLSMIPIAPDTYGGETIVGRKVYRTKTGGSTYYLLSNGTVANNTAVTLTDSDADTDTDGGTELSATTYPAGTETKKPPKCKFLLVNSNRLFLANDPSNGPSRIYYSKDASHDIIANTTDYFNIRLNDGDEITFAKNLLGVLTIGKNNSIQKLYTKGDDPSADWEISDPFSFIGCQAPYSVVNSPLGILYLTFDGIYKFNGQYSTLISDAITPIISAISETNYVNCWAEFHKNILYLAYTDGLTGATENDKVLLFDILSNAYSIDLIARNAFCTFNSGTDYGVLYSGSSINGEIFAHSETVHEIVHRRHSDFVGSWDTMRYIPTRWGGDSDNPVLELAWDKTIDELTGTIDSLVGIIDRPKTWGTYTSQILDTGATSDTLIYDKLYWNETIPGTGGDITFALRGADATPDILIASYSSEYSDPTGSDVSGVTAYKHLQYRISATTDSIFYSPNVIKAGNYVVRLTFDTEGTTQESAINLRYESGWNDFGHSGQIKNLKKIYVYYESMETGTLNITFENLEGDTDSFAINLIDHPSNYVEYFTNGAFLGEFIKLKIDESSLDDITIKRIILLYSVEPLI